MGQPDSANDPMFFRVPAPPVSRAQFGIGDVVRHRYFDFRGVIFDIDPVFNNSDEWYQSIPEDIRPRKDQPFYHLLAENGEASYVAYVSQQNLIEDGEEGPVDHPEVREMFGEYTGSNYPLKRELRH
jgi:heat shock protein HspQ